MTGSDFDSRRADEIVGSLRRQSVGTSGQTHGAAAAYSRGSLARFGKSYLSIGRREAHGGEHVALLVEQLKGSWIGNVEDRLYRNFTANDRIVGAVNEAHSALAEDLPDFVAAC